MYFSPARRQWVRAVRARLATASLAALGAAIASPAAATDCYAPAPCGPAGCAPVSCAAPSCATPCDDGLCDDGLCDGGPSCEAPCAYDACDLYGPSCAVPCDGPANVGCDFVCDSVLDSCDGCADTCDGSPAKTCGDGCSLFDKLPKGTCLSDIVLCEEDSCDGSGKKLTLSGGAAIRYRYYSEDNRLRPPGIGGSRQSAYNQWRTTPFVELAWGNDLILFAEGIDAANFGEDNGVPILPIDENRYDMLRYWADAKLLEGENGNLRARVGRQFLLYGDQHVLSPLAWANTFRNFEGARLYWEGENWDIDGFAMRGVNGPAGQAPAQFRFNDYDTPDQSRYLLGTYATYHGLDRGKLDLFWLQNHEQEPLAGRTDGNRHTIGARWYNTKTTKQCDKVLRTWKTDIQGGYQWGDDVIAGLNGGNEADVSAFFLSANSIYTFNDATWSPSIGGVFWYGSGDDDPNDDEINTIYTNYPLGHAYWGLADNFSGQNLIDYAIVTSVKPTKKLTLAAAFHFFDKAQGEDAIYNIANVRLGGAGGTANTDESIGQELDLLATYQASSNLQLQAGYFWFWYGDAVAQSAGGVPRADSDTFYFLANYTFGKKTRPPTGLRSIR